MTPYHPFQPPPFPVHASSRLRVSGIVFQWQISSTEIYLSFLLQCFPNSGKGCWGRGRGELQILWEGWIFLPGEEENLRRSDFDQLRLKLL